MAPFRVLLSPKSKFYWSDELNTLFHVSKEKTINAIKDGVQIFDITKKTCLRCSWSKLGIGYYQSQKHCECKLDSPDCCIDGWKITLAGSRFLSSAEQRYAPVEGEMLGVAWSLEQTKYFIQGCDNLMVVTDHKPLVKLLGDRTLDKIANTRLFRLKQRTLPWKFTIQHQPGKTNLAADATSRYPTENTKESDNSATCNQNTDFDNTESLIIASIQNDIDKMIAVTWDSVKAETEKDTDFKVLMLAIENGFPKNKNNFIPNFLPFWEYRNDLMVFDGVIIYNDRIVIPPTLRKEILDVLHSAH
ncbi:uncharacterized protein LOC124806330 [Hydra vulgaris]|uniref:uncharacterized protein LOC124806330 n=1 Tax=Hydra vulgaris TaxID=6087 RepID=UPI001F5F04CA|nr:uncharacterized protein LOC124806330 [Hydra vulgaris]